VILEVATLDIKPGREVDFEQAFTQARPIVASARGCLGVELRHCVEQANRYLLLVRWESLTDHTEGFRRGEDYQRWRALLHQFYDPFPTVEHYTEVQVG
jgi:heme-degrading monooxygenase HmoA